MTHRFPKRALIAGCAFSLFACGANDGETPEEWTEESLGEAEQAVDVANLVITSVHAPHVESGQIHYQSMTLWQADANHKLEAGVLLQKYQNGAWVV